MPLPWILIEIAFGKLVLDYDLEAPQSELLIDIRRSGLTACKAWYTGALCVFFWLATLLPRTVTSLKLGMGISGTEDCLGRANR